MKGIPRPRDVADMRSLEGDVSADGAGMGLQQGI